ncbi:MAG: beta-ribofuranosylaminobenzene 5'-phosphate synthase family protein [Gemmatimonadota bacterium]
MTTPLRTDLPVSVRIDAPARLHFGVLDLRGHRGRRFGGIGAAVPTPCVQLEATRSDDSSAEGPDAGRALTFARRFLEHHSIRGGAHLHVTRAIPAHAGLGSGTQLGLSVARALAELYGISAEPTSLARAVDRGRRSAIGTWTFALGGFVLEGGRRPGSNAVAPLITRLPIPSAWRCVIVVPAGSPGLSGEAEAAAFERLPEPSEHEVERVAHLVLMQLLPALVDADLPAFGSALTEIQRVTGSWFSSAQGGAFASTATQELVEQLSEAGAAGVGQSSWGPTVYGLAADEVAATRLIDGIRAEVEPGAMIFTTPFAERGALVQGAWLPGLS